MSRQLGSIPPQTSQPGRVGRPGMMLSDAILQTSEGSECRRPSSPARANLWAALVVPRADRLTGNPSFLTLLWFLRCRTCVCAQACNHGCDGGRDDRRCQQCAEANRATSMARADMTSPTVSAARAQVPATAKLSAAKTIKTTYHHGHRDG